MSHLEYISLFGLMLLDFSVAAAFAYMLLNGYAEDSLIRKTGVLILMAGILYQGCQCAIIIVSHQLISYTDYPFWMLKDIGAAVWVVGLIRRRSQQKRMNSMNAKGEPT